MDLVRSAGRWRYRDVGFDFRDCSFLAQGAGYPNKSGSGNLIRDRCDAGGTAQSPPSWTEEKAGRER